MASDTVQQIKDRLSIFDVVSQYVKLERSGANFRARCPFHAERTPSFFVSPERGTYHCFGCDVGGDIFSFVEQIEGLDFKGALKVLAEKAGVELVYERGRGKEEKDERDRLFELLETATIFYSSRLNKDVEKYLKERLPAPARALRAGGQAGGLGADIIKTFRLGWAGSEWSECSDHLKSKKFIEKEILDAGIARKGDKGLIDKFRNRIMFPIADSAGRTVGFSGRIFGEDASPEAPKYLNSPETMLFKKSRILYGFDKAKLAMRKNKCAVLVEGQMDLLASHDTGWTNTVAVSGTVFTPEHAALVRRMTDNLVIALDPDEAGFKAAARAARAALQGGLNVKVAESSEGLDPADLIQKKGKEAWSAAIRGSKDIITFLLDTLEKHLPAPRSEAARQAGAKDYHSYRRSVESVVLPFLADVGSPIARESYLREIAKRLGVSEQAVSEALAKVPHAPDAVTEDSHASDTVRPKAADLGRARQAYAILLWQGELKKPTFKIDAYKRELKEAIGKEALKALEGMKKEEKETLRFRAERLYGTRETFEREAKALLDVLLRERLSAELREATAALKEAEATGNEKEAGVHMSVVKLLTERIAKLHKSV